MSDIKLKGEDKEEALREWVKGIIKGEPGLGYDLGKFFFGVSAATIGAISGLEKLTSHPSLDILLVFSVVCLIVSIGISLSMVIPRIEHGHGNLDLVELHKEKLGIVKERLFCWVMMWGLGVMFGFFAILN